MYLWPLPFPCNSAKESIKSDKPPIFPKSDLSLPNTLSTLKGSYGRSGLDQGAPMCSIWAAAFLHMFALNSRIKMPLVRCPRAFRLRRLARCVGRNFGLAHLIIVNSRIKGLFWDVHVHVDRRRLTQSAGLSLPRAHFSWQAQYFLDLDKNLAKIATLGTLCGSDRSRCGAVLILANSLRSWWTNLIWLMTFEFSRFLYDDLARVSWCSLSRGPQNMKT